MTYSLLTGGTNIGTMTAQGGLVSAYDGTVSKVWTTGGGNPGCAVGASSATGNCGKSWGSAKTVTKYEVWGSSDFGYDSTGTPYTITLALRGSNNGSSWTVLHTQTFTDTNSSQPLSITSGITISTAYSYHDIYITGAGGPPALAQVKFYETIPVPAIINITDYATGSGDETTQIQAAIDAAAGGMLCINDLKTYTASNLTISSNLFILGNGLNSCIKQAASSTGDLFTISGTSTAFIARATAFDGNHANQPTLTNKTIKFTSVGTSSSSAIFDVQGNFFPNGNYADIQIASDSSFSTNEQVKIIGNYFLYGREGTSGSDDCQSINIYKPCNMIITDNHFISGTPSSYGRAGIVSYESANTNLSSRGIISGNYFERFGRSHSSSTLGCIDIYSMGNNLVISDNVVIQPYGRGIQIKSDCINTVISNNVVEGLNDLTSGGGGISGQIVVNRSITTTVGGNYIIHNNIGTGSGYDGLAVTGANSNFTDYADNVSIKSNTITGAANNGFYVSKVKNLSMSGNTGSGNACDLAISDIQTHAKIKDNDFLSSTPIALSGDVSKVVFSDNYIPSGAGNANRVTISSGAISALFDYLTVLPESGVTDDLETINGGYDGMRQTLRANDGTKDIVLKDGTGNLKLAGDFTLNNIEDTITLLKSGSVWYEICRSDNGA